MKQLLRRFYRDQTGQDLVEVALFLAFVAVIAAAVLPEVSHSIRVIFAKVELLWQGKMPSMAYVPPPTWGPSAATIRSFCWLLAALCLGAIFLRRRPKKSG